MNEKPECFGVRPFYKLAKTCTTCEYGTSCLLQTHQTQLTALESKVNRLETLLCIAALIIGFLALYGIFF